MVMADDRPSTSELEPREPTVEDLRDLCRELNQFHVCLSHSPPRGCFGA